MEYESGLFKQVNDKFMAALNSNKTTFGAVAKRMLGPIGVAIVVVSFGLCLHVAG